MLSRWIERLVGTLAGPDDAESILADLEVELAERRAGDGVADRWPKKNKCGILMRPA